MTGRLAISSSSSPLSRPKASWVSQVTCVSVTVITPPACPGPAAADFRPRGTIRSDGPAPDGGIAPSKEKHDPPAGRVQLTVTRGLPFVAAFRRTVGAGGEFPVPVKMQVRGL